MAYSTNLAIELITTGTQAGVWGSTTNTNLGTLIEQAISGYVTQAVTGGTDTLAMTPGVSATARNMFIELTGTGGGTLVVPSNKKLYFIYNNSSGAVTVKVTGLTGVAVPAAAKILLVCNGTDIVTATNYMISPTFVTPALGTPASGTLTNATGLPIDAGTINTLPVLRGGTGVTTSTGSGKVVLDTSPTLVTPILGTPTSGTMTNVTGLPLTTGVTGTLLVANGGTGVTASTGSGSNVLSTSPTLVTPALGTPTTLVGTNITGTAANLTAGTVTGGVYTADFTGANQSLTANGYQKLPGGLIIQWGVGTVPAGGVAVTFPVAFPSACASMGAVEFLTTSFTGMAYLQAYNVTASGFNMTASTTTVPFSYIAIGY